MLTPERIQHYETMGRQKVRDFAPQWSGQERDTAYEWLAREDESDRLRIEASYAESSRIARTAKNASIVAAIAAVIAVPIAAIAIVVSFLAWWYPHATPLHG